MSTANSKPNPHAMALIRGFLFPFVIVPVLFIPAGRLSYWQGWLYTGVNLAVLAMNYLLLRDKPDLIEERLKPGEGIKWWDRLYLGISSSLYFVALIVSALDTGRYGWSPRLGLPAYLAAYAVFLLGQGIFIWAKVTNRFFASVVRIQTDRGHAVCDRGPYRIVRHPGYVGGILFMLTTPLLLGSVWGVIPQGMAVILLIGRTALEDRTLRDELSGYEEYVGRVRYRLIPGIW